VGWNLGGREKKMPEPTNTTLTRGGENQHTRRGCHAPTVPTRETGGVQIKKELPYGEARLANRGGRDVYWRAPVGGRSIKGVPGQYGVRVGDPQKNLSRPNCLHGAGARGKSSRNLVFVGTRRFDNSNR